ncbi:UNVERIFIED_CONTAM: hypothetical protein FKN15_045975 [Acipenser sinensis]
MNNEDEFYDAVTGLESDESYEGSAEMSSKVASMIVNDSNSAKQKTNGSQPQENGIRKRRTTLPAPMFSRSDFSVWSILKKCIGLELSKITMPIVFNEPLSFLQRISEYMEPTYLIHKANSLADSVERMQVVAAFAVSAVASQWERTGKPFNPLLGETYELARDDQGFRLVSEQVSHHPPVSAFYAEGLNNDFIFQGSIYPKLKFWGKSVEAEPRGTITLELLNTGDKCVLNFKPCGMFGKELHRVEGYIQDKNKKKLCVIYGKWTECMWSVDPSTYDSFKKSEKKWVEPRKPKQNDDSDRSENDEADDMPEVQETVQVVPGSKLLWRVASRPPDSTQMYNFTNFAVTLNEMDPELIGVLAPTDCRFRPDIRAMENGDMDNLNASNMSSGALFPSMVSGSRGSSSKYLVEFRAGKMSLKGSTVTPDKRKGQVYVQQTDDSLIHFCWKDRTSGNVDDDLIIFPDDCEFKKVNQCTTGRVFVLKFKAGSKRLFFWMQEPKSDKDEENCRKVNEFLNNPPIPGALGSGGSAGHELSALGGEGGLQSLLGNMSHNQLMQLIGPTGLGGLGGLGALAGPGLASLLGGGGPTTSSSSSSSRSQSAAVTPSSTSSTTRISSASAPTPATPAATATTAASPTVTPTTPAASTITPTPTPTAAVATAGSPTQPIQLSDLQNILATMNVPAMAASGQTVDLASVLTPEVMAPILANADVQKRLLPYLPSGESLPQTAEEIQNTLTSPQFQQITCAVYKT